MGGMIKYTCTASCGRHTLYGGAIQHSSDFLLNFVLFAEANPEHVRAYGRHGPDELLCPECGAPALKKGTKAWRQLERARYSEWKARQASEESQRQAREATVIAEARTVIREAALDPSRIYLVARGQVRDVTERFRPAV